MANPLLDNILKKKEQKCNPTEMTINPSIIRSEGGDTSLSGRPVLVWCSLCPEGLRRESFLIILLLTEGKMGQERRGVQLRYKYKNKVSSMW